MLLWTNGFVIHTTTQVALNMQPRTGPKGSSAYYEPKKQLSPGKKKLPIFLSHEKILEVKKLKDFRGKTRKS